MSGSLTPNFVDLRWEKSNEIWYQLHVGTVSQSDATAGKSQNRELQRTVTFFPSRILACGLLQSIFILPRWSRSQSFRRLEHLVQKWQQKKLFKNCHFHLFFKFSQNFRWKNKKKNMFFFFHFIWSKKCRCLRCNYQILSFNLGWRDFFIQVKLKK